MAQNTAPIFPLFWDVTNNATLTTSGTFAWTILTATWDYTWVSANHQLVFTSKATDGSIIKAIRFKALWTNIATVARIFINNGWVNTTATNNQFFGELSLPATTSSNTVSTIDIDYVFPWNGLVLPPWFRIYIGVATTVASWWRCTPIGGQF